MYIYMYICKYICILYTDLHDISITDLTFGKEFAGAIERKQVTKPLATELTEPHATELTKPLATESTKYLC